MTGVDAAAIERLLAAHQRKLTEVGECICGEWPDRGVTDWPAHVAATLAPLLQAQHDGEDVRAAVSEELLSLTAFRELGATIHRFRCTSPDCRHYDDDGYFTPRDNDAASAAYYWLRAALSSPAPAEDEQAVHERMAQKSASEGFPLPLTDRLSEGGDR